jgi:hypothetical protein
VARHGAANFPGFAPRMSVEWAWLAVYIQIPGLRPSSHPSRRRTPVKLEAVLSRIIQRILKLLTRNGYLIEEQGMRYPGRSRFRSRAQARSKRGPAPIALRRRGHYRPIAV